MKICILGLGHIGLPTATLFAVNGHNVIGVDTNMSVLRAVGEGRTPFDEPGLPELLKKAVNSGHLVVGKDAAEADSFIIAVPTPLDKGSKKADLKYVRSAIEMICPRLRRGNLVVLESTVPPGTTEGVVVPILEKSKLEASSDFYLAFCPERAMPGNTIHEMIYNDRVIGGINSKSAELTVSLYSSFVKGSIHPTGVRTAEFVKLIENTFRDVNIAFANELALIAEELSVNVWDAIRLANKHPRVNILRPGPGVGGHCLTKDPWFLTQDSTRQRMVSLARETNDEMPTHILQIVRSVVKDIKDPVVTVLGAGYKGGVGDTSEAPTLRFVELAEKEGFKIKIHDPHIKGPEHRTLGLEEAVKGSDCVILMTDHPEFRDINVERVSALMRNRNLIDTRNMLDREQWEKEDFRVRVLGDGTAM